MSRRNWKKEPSAPVCTSGKRLRAAIYARVSTQDQKCEMQLSELRDYCERRQWEVGAEYVDQGVGGAVNSRPALDKLKAAARERRFDALIVWKLDRWGRSLIDCINGIRELAALGIRFVAVTQNIDTDESNPSARFMMNMLFAFAEFERELIQERILAGMAQQKRNIALGRYGRDIHSHTGKDMPPGRPRRVFRRDLAQQMKAAGLSYRQIGEQLDVPTGTVFDALTGRKKKPTGKAA